MKMLMFKQLKSPEWHTATLRNKMHKMRHIDVLMQIANPSTLDATLFRLAHWMFWLYVVESGCNWGLPSSLPGEREKISLVKKPALGFDYEDTFWLES